MTKFILSFLLVPWVAVLFYSCSDSPTAAGKQFLKQDLVGVEKLDSQNDTLAQTSSYHKFVPIPGGSYQLLLGKLDNVEARTLLQLSIVIPDSLKSDISSGNATIKNATLFFTRHYVYGDTLAPLSVNVYEITSDWTSTGFTSDSLSKLTYNSNNVATTFTTSDTGLAINLSTQLMNNWFSYIINGDSSAIKGILISPGSASGKVVGYESLNYSGGTAPYLSVIIQKPNVYTDSLIFGTYQDLSVVTGSLPNISSQEIAVQGGLALRSKLRFDLSKLPSNIVVNDAPLFLNINSAESILGTDSISSIIAYRLVSAGSDSFDSTKSVVLSRSGNTFSGNIATYIRDWEKGAGNYGLLLLSQDEVGSVDLFTMYGSTSPQANRPRLTIYYTK